MGTSHGGGSSVAVASERADTGSTGATAGVGIARGGAVCADDTPASPEAADT